MYVYIRVVHEYINILKSFKNECGTFLFFLPYIMILTSAKF